MVDEPIPTNEDIKRLVESGDIFAAIEQHQRIDNSLFLNRCIDLHNLGEVNLLSLTSSSIFDALSGWDFFSIQHFLVSAIPRLSASHTDMMNFVTKLVAKGGSDLAADRPNSAFLEWLKIVICLCFGGEIHENVRDRVVGYRRLIDHPENRSKEYFEEATAGSTLLPLLIAWLAGFGRTDLVARLSKLSIEKLGHCNMQLWTPDQISEEHLYMNSEQHGAAISELPITDDGADLIRTVADACGREESVKELSVVKIGLEPIALMACRHWRLPIPPWFWITPIVNALDEPTTDPPTTDDDTALK